MWTIYGLTHSGTEYSAVQAGFEGILGHLSRVGVPADDETLFAMKCAAARTDLDRGDIDILAKRLGIRSSEQALALVLRYFPEDRLPVRTRLLLEELLDDRP